MYIRTRPIMLAEFERQFHGDFLLVTQNIDDLGRLALAARRYCTANC